MDSSYQGIKTVFTIHNIEFQGQFDSGMLWEIFGVGYERYADGTLRWNDCLNWMKAAVLYADRVTTVSPSYAGEIQTPEFGKGLDQIMRMESGKLSGIVNGIDTDLLDPETDAHIPYHFSVDDLSGKAKDKAALQERVGLPVREDVPLIGIVSRLTDQKVSIWWLTNFTTSCNMMFRLFFWVLVTATMRILSLGSVTLTQKKCLPTLLST